MWSLVRLGISSRKVCLLLGTRLHSSWTAWPLKMGPACGTGTSVQNYHYTLRKIPKSADLAIVVHKLTPFFNLLFVFSSVLSSALLTLVPSTQLLPISLYVWAVLTSYCIKATLECNKIWSGSVRRVIHVPALDLMLRWKITEDGLKTLQWNPSRKLRVTRKRIIRRTATTFICWLCIFLTRKLLGKLKRYHFWRFFFFICTFVQHICVWRINEFGVNELCAFLKIVD
jgi:hypothetical protein